MNRKLKKIATIEQQTNTLSQVEVSKLREVINKSSVLGLVETVTGILGTSKSDLIMSAGRIGQAMIRGETLKQFFVEIQELRDKGRINDQYLNSKYGKKDFADLLRIIESENLDPKKWDAIKKVFYCSVDKNSEENSRAKAHYLMQLCLSLDAFDFETLTTCYKIYKMNFSLYQNVSAAGEWIKIISDKLDYGLPELVEQAESNLMEKKLLTGRLHNDRTGVTPGYNLRLTSLGIALCDLINS